MTDNFIITPELVTKLLATVDAGLVSGLGQPKPGQMCVEAAVCYAMGLPHGDEPTCVAPAIRRLKITLNDSAWSSDIARAKGMRRLAVLQLGTKDGFDQIKFAKRVALFTIRSILPIALSAAGLTDHAETCANVTTLLEGQKAARAAAAAADATRAADAAARAAEAAEAAEAASRAASRAAYAADAAAEAECVATRAAEAAEAAEAASRAAYAADAADGARDSVLSVFADGVSQILIDMKVPAVAYLHLIDGPA